MDDSDADRCDADTQKIIASQTFEALITSSNGMTISRALVNVVIDQQIGQQISVSQDLANSFVSRPI
jgi:hypothetical protein